VARDQLTGKQHAFVAAYLGEANRNATEAARIAGYQHPMQQGNRLLRNVEIMSQIDSWRGDVKVSTIATIEGRVDVLTDIAERYGRLIRERAEEMAGEIAGGGTGLLVRTTKQIGTGRNAETITEYRADTAVTKELRETIKQLAIELGQWNENKTLTIKHVDEVILEVAQRYGIDPAELAAELEGEL
jgi:hypothetical protein